VRLGRIQILSPRPAFVLELRLGRPAFARNEVENEDCRGVAESEAGLLLKAKTDRCELCLGKPELKASWV